MLGERRHVQRALALAAVVGVLLAGCTDAVATRGTDRVAPEAETELWTESSPNSEADHDAFLDHYAHRDSSILIASDADAAAQWRELPEIDFTTTVAVLVVHGTCHPKTAVFSTSHSSDLFLEMKPVKLDNNYECGEDSREIVLYEFDLDDLGASSSSEVTFTNNEDEG